MQNSFIRIQEADFDLTTEVKALRKADPRVGAVVTFVGTVRDMNDGSVVKGMTLEHYPGMTEQSLANITQQATARWPLQAVRVIHRVGVLNPCDQIVLVITSSAHRSAAFESAEFIMDYLKTSAPFWKKQVAGEHSEWVASRESDYRAAERWTKSGHQ